MTSRAQLTQERSRQRRGELLAAAIELFAEGGARAITHRAVAARAAGHSVVLVASAMGKSTDQLITLWPRWLPGVSRSNCTSRACGCV